MVRVGVRGQGSGLWLGIVLVGDWKGAWLSSLGDMQDVARHSWPGDDSSDGIICNLFTIFEFILYSVRVRFRCFCLFVLCNLRHWGKPSACISAAYYRIPVLKLYILVLQWEPTTRVLRDSLLLVLGVRCSGLLCNKKKIIKIIIEFLSSSSGSQGDVRGENAHGGTSHTPAGRYHISLISGVNWNCPPFWQYTTTLSTLCTKRPIVVFIMTATSLEKFNITVSWPIGLELVVGYRLINYIVGKIS